MHKRALGCLIIGIASLGVGVGTLAQDAQSVAPDFATISESDMKADVYFLASDAMNGRETLARESTIASEYIRSRFQKAGLKPAGENGGWFQEVQLAWNEWKQRPTIAIVRDGETTELKYEKDFVSTDGATASIKASNAEVVFAGYAVNDPNRKWNDFEGVDLKGKIALILRYEPTPWRRRGRNPFSRNSYLQIKTQHCLNAGAIGVLMVTGPDSVQGRDASKLPPVNAGEKSPSLMLATDKTNRRGNSIPFFHLSIGAADKLLGGDGKLLELQRKWDKGDFTTRPDFGKFRLNLAAESERKIGRDRNVLAKIEGETDEIVILGAHHDHLGLGYFGARDARTAMGEIHNGADDNASGCSAILEIAEAIAQSGIKPKRTIVFMTFTGEEKGLLGSRWYVENPIHPHNKVIAMVNIDMLGRLSGNKFVLHGPGVSPKLRAVSEQVIARNSDINVTINPRTPMPASDHWPFYSKAGIPVVFPFGRIPPEMHTAKDDPETINYDGLVRGTRFMADLVWSICQMDGFPEYSGPVKDAIGPDGKPRHPDAPKESDEKEEDFSVR